MTELVPVTDNSFDAQVLKCDIPVLAHFGAEWSAPGQKMAAILAKVADEYEGRVKMVKLDVEANPMVASNYAVLNIPTLILFKNGQEVERITDRISRTDLLKKVTPYID